MKPTTDVIIIGAGVIGLSIAHRLAGAGLTVTIVEKGLPGQEASHAAAGMLAPQADIAHSVPEPLLALLESSHALYPDFVISLQAECGINIGYQTAGSILVATDYQEAKMLAGVLERQLQRGTRIEELTTDKLKQLEPALANSNQAGLLFPNDHWVNNRELLQALIAVARKRGVSFVPHTPVLGLEVEGDRVIGVRLPQEVVTAGQVINCAGAWAGLVDPCGEICLPVRPIRGQIICLHQEKQTLHHLIHSSKAYLAPWPDGRVLVGATMDNVGFNKSNTAAGFQHLLSSAIGVVPELKNAIVVDFWAGLRPDTPDNLPIIGKTELENYMIATGHFRNGILLAPITANLIAELTLTGQASISLEAFSAARFRQCLTMTPSTSP